MHIPTTISIAALGFTAYTNAHMMMAQPVPYGKSTLNNSPLAGDGSDFPCKQRPGVYDAEGANNQMALGSSQPLTFIGSAVHGGGSCQVSITYDQNPTKSSIWKVIHSIEGGCPARNQAGNLATGANSPDPDTYSFTVPTTLPTGSATVAWTWFNKVGNREMYMNCAPITLTAGSSKRSEDEELLVRNITQLMERDQNAYNALPDMFIANIGNGCTTVDSTDVLFPAPGDSVEQDGLSTSSALHAPTGSCGSTAAGAAPTAGSGGGSSGSAASSVAPNVATAAVPTPSSAPPSDSAPSQGGVFATAPVASASAAPAATSVAEASPAAATAAATQAASPPPEASSAPSSSASTTTSSAGTFTQGSACSTEGQWNCIDGSSFQRCASGIWSVVMSVAAGTTCETGQSMAISIKAVSVGKRDIRFSTEHMRRHLRRASS